MSGPQSRKSLPFAVGGAFLVFVGRALVLLADTKWGHASYQQSKTRFALPFLARAIVSIFACIAVALLCCSGRVTFHYLRSRCCCWAVMIPIAHSFCSILVELLSLRSIYYVPYTITNLVQCLIPLFLLPLAKRMAKDSERVYCSPVLMSAMLFFAVGVAVHWAPAYGRSLFADCRTECIGWTVATALSMVIVALSVALMFVYMQKGIVSEWRQGPSHGSVNTPLLAGSNRTTKIQTLAVVCAWLLATSLSSTAFYALCPAYESLPVLGTPRSFDMNKIGVPPMGIDSINISTAYRRFGVGLALALGASLEGVEQSPVLSAGDGAIFQVYAAVYVVAGALMAFGFALSSSVSPFLGIASMLCGQVAGTFVAFDNSWIRRGWRPGETWSSGGNEWENNLDTAWNVSLSFAAGFYVLSFGLCLLWEYREQKRIESARSASLDSPMFSPRPGPSSATPRVSYRPPMQQPAPSATRRRGIEPVTDISEVLHTTLDPDGMFAQMQRRQGKIDIAAAAMISFLTAIMRPADRCSITAFNKKFIPLVNLGDEDHCKAMMVYLTAICQDSTMLYDAIALSVVQFVVTADRSRPWLLIVLTDGDDTGSESSLSDAANALRQFTAAHNNHAFIVGIGNDVKADLMTRLADSSGSMYIPAEQASALPVLFALIALQVQQGIQVDIAAIRSEGAEAVLARVQRTQRLGFQNVDMLLLVDVSGSMTTH